MDARTFGSRLGFPRREIAARLAGALLLAAFVVPALSVSAAGCGVCDDDADGLTNAEEISYGTDLSRPDTDGDGISDMGEIYNYGTNPVAFDTDGDSFGDWDEIRIYFTSPLVYDLGGYAATVDDIDGDGLGDHEEVYIYGTDPQRFDTDGDDASDGGEVRVGTNPLVFDAYGP
jgi:hypothetical protein